MLQKNNGQSDSAGSGDVPEDAGDGSGTTPAADQVVTAGRKWLALLLQDRFACAAVLILIGVALCAVLGPLLIGDLATRQNLRDPGREPFSLDHGWAFVLGSDSLGRPVAARLIAAAGTTLSVAVPAVLCSLVVGSVWGMWAGFHGVGARTCPCGSPT